MQTVIEFVPILTGRWCSGLSHWIVDPAFHEFESRTARHSNEVTIKTHIDILITCSCGSKVIMTKIQFDDFDCGMMGTLKCHSCGKVLLPTTSRNECSDSTIKQEEVTIPGEDKGWKQ